MFNEKFSEDLIKKVVNVQENLLKKALKLVSSGGIIVYSTCSILKDENEKILEKVKSQVEIIPLEKFEDEKIKYLNGQEGTITVCPNSYYEGFFIAKLKKI